MLTLPIAEGMKQPKTRSFRTTTLVATNELPVLLSDDITISVPTIIKQAAQPPAELSLEDQSAMLGQPPRLITFFSTISSLQLVVLVEYLTTVKMCESEVEAGICESSDAWP